MKLPKPFTRARTEADLHKAVVQAARWHLRRDVFWFHPANGGSRHLLEAVNLKRMGVRAGVPDLVFVFQGRAHFIELKAPKGRASDSQQSVHGEISRAGAPIAICRTLDDVIACWRRWRMTNAPADPEDAARRVA